jgi:peptide chain release factor
MLTLNYAGARHSVLSRRAGEIGDNQTVRQVCHFAVTSQRQKIALSSRVEKPIEKRMARLGIRPTDLEEAFSRSSGPGGQNVNKVATAVTLRHRPSGISVTAQDSRSQAVNRKLARERLVDAIEKAQKERRTAEIALREKARRQKSARPPRLKRRILESKRKRSDLKKLRSRIEL